MAEYIKTLKEDNGDITYPVTQAGAVLLSGGGDLETTLNAKASQTSVNGKIDIGDVQSTDIVSNAVTTAKIADGNVTTAKIANGSLTYPKFVTEDVTDSTTITVVSGNINASVNKAYRMGNIYAVSIVFTASASITVAAHSTYDVGTIKLTGETLVGGSLTTVNSVRFMIGVVQPGGTHNDDMLLRLYNMTGSSATISSGGGLGTATAWFIVA